MSYGAKLTELEAGTPYRAIIPQKIPVGGSVKGTKRPGLFKVYVPSRDGFTLGLDTTAGSIELFAPDGSPARDAKGEFVKPGASVKLELPDGVYGWFGVVVRDASSYEVSCKLSCDGHARDADGAMLVPWHFYYFPFSKVVDDGMAHPSAKWQQKFGGSANDWEKANYWGAQIDGTGAAGQHGHGITREYVDAYNRWAGSEVVKFDDTWWWGHCDAAGVASALFKQLQGSGGFEEQDLKFFATEVSMRGYDIECTFFLGGVEKGNRNLPSHKEKPSEDGGKALDLDAGPFHDALIDCVKKKGSVALVDFRAEWKDGEDHSADVWNQAVYRFTMEMKQARADRGPADDEASARALEIKTVIHGNADTAGLSGNPEEPKDSGWNRECTYVLNFDANGKSIPDHPQNLYKKCTWERTGEEYYAPRYIFRIKGLNLGKQGHGNPYIRLKQARPLGLELRKVFGPTPVEAGDPPPPLPSGGGPA